MYASEWDLEVIAISSFSDKVGCLTVLAGEIARALWIKDPHAKHQFCLGSKTTRNVPKADGQNPWTTAWPDWCNLTFGMTTQSNWAQPIMLISKDGLRKTGLLKSWFGTLISWSWAATQCTRILWQHPNSVKHFSLPIISIGCNGYYHLGQMKALCKLCSEIHVAQNTKNWDEGPDDYYSVVPKIWIWTDFLDRTLPGLVNPKPEVPAAVD